MATLILVTNDDSITAPGLRALIEIMNNWARLLLWLLTVLNLVWVMPLLSTTLHCSKISLDEDPSWNTVVLGLQQIASNLLLMSFLTENLTCVFPASIMDRFFH